MVCHIWDNTAYDNRYFTSVANLVLLPKSIGGLSDYYEPVMEILRYRAYERFDKFYPRIDENDPDKYKPKKPSIYKDLVWRDEL